ncbi:MAG TPA: polysaccharide pyruvyl transferase family protein [Hyphomonadaceae bacterium]|jgi:hypothetical protein|nr:polysaccharide pyruvyl transferase family protein [Hyphomonadaceae bacterium]
MLRHVFRRDQTNVGDWYCPPFRYFDLGGEGPYDIHSVPVFEEGDDVILGGGGVIAKSFAPHMEALTAQRPRLRRMIAWGVGESLNVDKSGGLVAPWNGPLPDYLKAFDLVGVRDFGTENAWVPCASCMLGQFDRSYEVSQEIVIYDHKRIPIPIDGFPRRSNDGDDIDATLAFLASAELVITNSYHGAYWATLLGRRVIAIPNMSKIYRMKHAPVICRPDMWRRYADAAVAYPQALAECRKANRDFCGQVKALLAS